MNEPQNQFESDAWTADIPQFSYAEWVDRFFNRPYDPENWREPSEAMEEEDFRSFCFWTNGAVPHLVRLFQQPETLLKKFSNDQIGAGIWNINTAVCKWRLYSLRKGEVPLTDGLGWIRALVPLNSRLFAKISPPVLRRRTEPEMERTAEGYAAGQACYMFWDLLADGTSLTGNEPEDEDVVEVGDEDTVDAQLHQEIDGVCIDVLKEILLIDNASCQAGAIHGLGHWHAWEPELVEAAIDQYLRSGRALNDDLADYARAARTGEIL